MTHATARLLAWGLLILPGFSAGKSDWLGHETEAPADTRADSVRRFTTSKYSVLMEVHFAPPYEGQPLRAYRSVSEGKKDFLSAETGGWGRIERFVGALAVVRYTVTRASDHKSVSPFIREVVTVVDQSPGLPARKPFSMTVNVVKGVASDWQVFGYDESPLPPERRAPERAMAGSTWRRYRQELFLDDATRPFAVVWWHHTTTRIRILRVDTPPDRLTNPE